MMSDRYEASPAIDYAGELNPEQLEGCLATEGPVLILAGAGSGKTRVLTHRVAYLISEKGVAPWNIMAITFTNKAAQEMRERVNRLVGYGAESVWIATFHSTCVRILRRDIDLLGYDANFTIYDADDQKTLMKRICKDLQIDTKNYKEKMFLGRISSAKDELINAQMYANRASESRDFMEGLVARVYTEYASRLKAANALDFDDLILKTVELLKAHPDVQNHYQNLFRYIMVDEYQDTNTAQFELVRLLAGTRQNLCVVGDDDQSIYKFRGANIHNILNFEQHYPSAKVIRLEQNYRSTKSILNAANRVIANNAGRKSKTLWTENDEGPKIRFEQCDSEYEEAEHVMKRVRMLAFSGKASYADMAVLYRTNAQSRVLEEIFLRANIPYRIVGGVNFYARREVKDLLAYLRVIENPADEVSLRRIVNVPKRGIGETSVSKAATYAITHDETLFAALLEADKIPGIGRTGLKMREFARQLEDWREQVSYGEISVSELMDDIIDETGYVQELEAEETVEAQTRIENIEELQNKIAAFEDTDRLEQRRAGGGDGDDEDEDEDGEDLPGAETVLTRFLADVSLIADIDTVDPNADCVLLMTLHAAKGLEFPYVFMVGMEDGLFPSRMSLFEEDDESEIEEERRLCYVGITRAMKELFMTAARTRMVRGERQYGSISRFVKEIPPELIEGSTWERESRREAYSGSYDPDRSIRGYRTGLSGSGADRAPQPPSGRPAAGSMAYRNPQGEPFVRSRHRPAQDFSAKIAKEKPAYDVGDRVRHQKFGEGTVEDIRDGGRDFEVTVAFDTAGTKKMFASFARLEKL